MQNHAVVLGASMSGLLAARALSNHFEQVTIIERDKLPDAAALRKGVPQAAHAHGLLASGYRIMESYFPGMMDDLVQQGGVTGDVVGGFLWYQYGHWKLRHDAGVEGIVASRPAIEGAILKRVRALPNVSFREETDGEMPDFDKASGNVTGITVKDRHTNATESIAADLVVDAAGRGSQAPKWLEQWGFERPEEELVKVDVGYATRTFRRTEGELYGAMGAVIAGQAPQTRFVAILGAEVDRWMITMAGMAGDYPPTDEEGWLAFAKSLPTPDAYDLVTHAEPLSEIVSYRFPANQRRRYEKMKRRPGHFVSVGDAVCSFNPIYGQGMSVAALESKALDECLASGAADLPGTFYKRASKLVDIPWTIATGEDFRYTQIAGKRPPGYGPVSKYLEKLHAVRFG